MSRIVITSFGSYGDVNSYLGLALALRGASAACDEIEELLRR